MEYVFVYGTLKRGFPNFYGRLDGTIGYSKFINKFQIKGKMYDLGHFPVVCLEEDGIVFGELFEIDKKVLDELDILEGYPEFYNRSRIILSNGIETWIYHMQKDQIHTNKVIFSGEWTQARLN